MNQNPYAFAGGGMDGYVSKPIRVETNRQFCCLAAP